MPSYHLNIFGRHCRIQASPPNFHILLVTTRFRPMYGEIQQNPSSYKFYILLLRASPLRPQILALEGPRIAMAIFGGPSMVLDLHGACGHMPKALLGTPFFHARVAVVHPNFARIFSISCHSNIMLPPTTPAPFSNHVPFVSCPVL